MKDRISDSQRVRVSLKDVEELRTRLWPILRALEKIKWDRDRVDEKYKIYGILDFRDLNRYLHPLLDLTAYQYPDRFYSEQLAIQYAISRRPIELFLIDEYMYEYNLALRNAQIELAEFILKSDKETRTRIINLDNVLSRFLEEFSSGEDPHDRAVVTRVASLDLVMLDLLFDDMRMKILQEGMKVFSNLRTSGAIRSPKDMEGVSLSDLKPQRGEEFSGLLEAMEQVRPGSKKTNETDAAAFHVVQHLNRKHYARRIAFLYISSAQSVLRAFDSKYAIEHVLDKRLYNTMKTVSVVRDPQYFLLRFLIEHHDSRKGILPFDRLLDLSKRFMDAAKALEGYFGKALTRYEIIDVEFQSKYHKACELADSLRPSIDTIKEFGLAQGTEHSLSTAIRARLDLRPLLQDTKITDALIRERINGALEKPKALVSHFVRNSKELAVAIDGIELGLAPIIFKQDKTDVIYRMTVSNENDKKLKEIANVIVDALCRESLDDFRQAFKTLGKLRNDKPLLPDTLVLTSKVYRSVRAYREALDYAQMAYERDPESMEVLFELCSCYVRRAVSEENNALYLTAWEYCSGALQKAPENARVLKVRAYLLWRAFGGEWHLPDEFADNPLERILEISERAYVIAEGGRDEVLTTAVANDRAYYLCLTDDAKIIREQAVPLIDDALERAKTHNLRRRGAYEDTKGYALLQLYLLEGKNDRGLLDEAGRAIHAGYKKDRANRTRAKHMDEWMELWEEAM